MRTLLGLMVLLAACGERGGGGDGGGIIRVDGGPCELTCEPPPIGCRYEPAPAGECRCGTVVCPPDGGGEAVCCAPECDPPAFPTFGRSCTSADGCFVAHHTSDCCGTIQALGLSVSERDRFDAAEAICDPMYPGCGCAPGPTMADDGSTCFDSPVAVACVDGICISTCAAGP